MSDHVETTTRYDYYYENGQLYGRLPYSSKYDEFVSEEEYFEMADEVLADYGDEMGE